MSAANSIQSGLTFQDSPGKRLRWAVLASLFVNLGLWTTAATVIQHPPPFQPLPVEITRVILDKGKKIEKVVTKKQIEKKVAKVRREIQKPKPKPIVVHVRPKPIRVAQRPPKPPPPAPKPQGAHTRVILAKVDKTAPPPAPTDHVALPGGNAAPGKPIEAQNPGNATQNPAGPVSQEPVKPAPPPPPPPPAPVKVEKPAPPAPPVKVVENTPPPVPTPPPPPPPAPEKPKHHGPTQDAKPEDEVKPNIPDDLKHGDLKTFVRVRVEIDEDGNATTILRTSSGNTEVDALVLDALKKWKWKPALKDGVPVASTQLFKFEFEVE